MKNNILFLISLISFSSFAFQGQLKETKYIYALDITLSMWGFGDNPDIFNEVRDELISSINSIDSPKSEIVIYTFQDDIIDTWSVEANNEGKKFLTEKLNEISKESVPRQNTNIYKAWSIGKSHVDASKINVFFLLTDGSHTVKHTPKSKLYNVVKDWNTGHNDIYSFGFLVELTEKAKDNQLRSVIENTDNTQVISGIKFNVLDIENKTPVVNIHDDLNFKFNLLANSIHNFDEEISFTVKSNNQYFIVENGRNLKFDNLPIVLKLTPTKDVDFLKKNLNQKEKIELEISYNEQKFSDTKLLMKKFHVDLNNKKEKVLKVEIN